MEQELNVSEKIVLCKYFGIDEPYDNKASVSKIAQWFGKSEIWVKKQKANALKKMQQEHVKELIEKYMQN